MLQWRAAVRFPHTRLRLKLHERLFAYINVISKCIIQCVLFPICQERPSTNHINFSRALKLKHPRWLDILCHSKLKQDANKRFLFVQETNVSVSL